MVDLTVHYHGDDFHFAVRVHAKSPPGRNGVVVDHQQRSEAHPFGVVMAWLVCQNQPVSLLWKRSAADRMAVRAAHHSSSGWLEQAIRNMMLVLASLPKLSKLQHFPRHECQLNAHGDQHFHTARNGADRDGSAIEQAREIVGETGDGVAEYRRD